MIFFLFYMICPPQQLQYFKAQAGQDRYLYQQFFSSKCGNGTFVEFGARNGIEHSNTYFFEKALGWHGILFEADRREYKTLKQNRPNSIVFNGAICPKKTQNFINISISINPGWSGMEDTYTQKRRSSLYTRNSVKCHHLASKLNKMNLKSVDLMTIDTEGSEYSIIKSFPWKQFQIQVVMIESLNENKYPSQRGNQKRMIRVMQYNCYKLHRIYVVEPLDTDDLIFTKIC
jgi:FkbM family methyltransferase